MQILFVDDQPELLQGLKRTLRKKRKQWEMTFAGGGKEAIDLVASSCFDIVVTDMKMPAVDGAEVLVAIEKHCPNTLRVVLSGQAELSQLYVVLDKAHQYFSKPCDSEELQRRLETLENNSSTPEVIPMKDKLASVITLPLTKKTVEFLNERESVEPAEFVDVALSDIGVAANLARLVSSAFFGPKRKVKSIHRALEALGSELLFDTFRLDTIAKTSANADEVSAKAKSLLNKALEISHSLSLNDEQVQLIELACLLSFCGELACKESALEIPSQKFLQVVNRYLLVNWNLSEKVIELVTKFETPSEATNQSIELSVLHLAYALGKGPEALDEKYLEQTGLDYKQFWS